MEPLNDVECQLSFPSGISCKQIDAYLYRFLKCAVDGNLLKFPRASKDRVELILLFYSVEAARKFMSLLCNPSCLGIFMLLIKKVSTKMFIYFVLLNLEDWILRGNSRTDVTGTDAARWLSVPPLVV